MLQRYTRRKKLVIVLLVIFLLVGAGVWWYLNRQPATEQKNSSPTSSEPSSINPPAEVTQQQNNPQFDKAKYSLADPNSLWVVVNKKRPLPNNYKPGDLVVPDVPLRLGSKAEQMQVRAETATALKEMFAGAKIAGHKLMLGSGFRSYTLQKSFYDGYVAKDGKAAADTYSARPGHSEHQTGWGLDIDRLDQKCHLEKCLGDLPEAKWLAQNAFKYGFILRYTTDKESVTGFQYEPWHFRYIGKELAAEMQKQNITTLEEFFGLPAAPGY
jgi:zinc D-Ala-D-Ala carboxypeptidase